MDVCSTAVHCLEITLPYSPVLAFILATLALLVSVRVVVRLWDLIGV